jgi:hypothetical protein
VKSPILDHAFRNPLVQRLGRRSFVTPAAGFGARVRCFPAFERLTEQTFVAKGRSHKAVLLNGAFLPSAWFLLLLSPEGLYDSSSKRQRLSWIRLDDIGQLFCRWSLATVDQPFAIL